MIELINIKKSYTVEKSSKLQVLQGISLSLGDTGFVSILGPSGCGKTTLLNIVGGLDRYDDGDILVDGKSTKHYSDKDWDTYRNRKIGIVFQSYNLIPHLSILANVELAMTLSGTPIKYRKKKATETLKKVGLGKEMGKKPNQLSGGQMQRVAIARAIVNDPGIILADEPTGALDSKTSVQILDILKELSKSHLVIMVTHNEELADQYSTRIIRMLDGTITSDTPISENETKSLPVNTTIDSEAADLTMVDPSFSEKIQQELNTKKKKKSSMSFGTALNISAHNLMTKKGRTTLTSVAGSFGIIGVALVLSLSNGFNNYVNRLERGTLSQFPISIEKYGVESITSMRPNSENKLQAYPSNSDIIVEQPNNTVFHVNTITDDYVLYLDNMDSSLTTTIKYNHSVETNAVTLDATGTPIVLSTGASSLVSTLTSSSYWTELPGDKTFITSQYDVIGRYPENKNEVLISVDKYNRVSYSTMKALGYDVSMATGTSSKTFSLEEIQSKVYKIFNNNQLYTKHSSTTEHTGCFLKDDASLGEVTALLSSLTDKMQKFMTENPEASGLELFNYIGKLSEYKSLMEQFKKTEETQTLDYYTKKSNEELKALYEDPTLGEEIRVVGILRPKQTATVDLLGLGVYYTEELTNWVLESNKNTDLAQELKRHCYREGPLNFTFISAINNDRVIDISTYTSQRLAVGTDQDITSITIYPKSFSEKKQITKYLDDYNKAHPDDKVVYTDLASLLASSVGTMIDIISIVLICFAAISLLTSSVMIGIITYTSVIERTKEIGILRSIGARKKDVSRLFEAETVIIGFISGLIGVLVAYIGTVPINLIINHSFPESNIGTIASLHPLHALLLVGVSMLLTFIAGFAPARMASKKDPVICLRTE